MRPAALLPLSLLVAAGCAKRIDRVDAETKIRAWATEHVAPVDQVSCPAAVMETGTSFECQVTFKDGSRHALVVTQRDDRGTVAWEWRAPIAGADHLAGFLTEQLLERDQPAAVDCGSGIVTLPATCAAVYEGARTELVVTSEGGTSLAWAPR